MQKLFLPLIVASITLTASCSSQTAGNGVKANYDFDASKYKYNTQTDLVKAFIATLSAGDTSNMQQYAITEEVISYAATLMDKDDTIPVEQKVEKARKELNGKIKRAWGPTLRNLVKTMSDDNVDLSTSTITIDSLPSKQFKSCNYILKGKVTVSILTKDQKPHKLTIYDLLKVKNKWFILGPKWEWNDHGISNRPN